MICAAHAVHAVTNAALVIVITCTNQENGYETVIVSKIV